MRKHSHCCSGNIRKTKLPVIRWAISAAHGKSVSRNKQSAITDQQAYHLARFLEAQEEDYILALKEIRQGKKMHHWMWYIFPQLSGLGTSSTAQYYAVKNIEEARLYAAHPVLGPRLVEISKALLALPALSARSVFGTPDDLKLCSCMTLFEATGSPHADVFKDVLDKYFNGCRDTQTLMLLQGD